MAQIIVALNFPSTNIAEIGKIVADAQSGQAIVTLENPQNITGNDFLLVGEKGQSTAELKKVLSLTGNNVTFTANLALKHYYNEPVYKLRGDQIKVYRANNVNGQVPVDGLFSTIATFGIDPDQPSTEYFDADGGEAYWYKYTYFNSDSLVETDLVDSVATRGGDYHQYCTVDDVRNNAGFDNNTYIPDAIIDGCRTSAQDFINGALSVAGYTLPLTDSYGNFFVPPSIKYLTTELAAGFLLRKDYGVGADGTNKEGKSKIDWVMDILKKITDRELSLSDLENIALNQDTGMGGWPDSTTKDQTEEDAGGGIAFSISHKF